MAKIALEEVVKELKLVKVIVTLVIMVIVQWNFSAVTNPVVMVNDCWLAIILNAAYTYSIRRHVPVASRNFKDLSYIRTIKTS